VSRYCIWSLFYECLNFMLIKTSNKIALGCLKSKSLSTTVEIFFLVSKRMDILWPPWNLSLMLLFKVFYSNFYACIWWRFHFGGSFVCKYFTSLRTFMFSLIKLHWKLLCSRKDLFFNFFKQRANFVIGFTIGCTKIN